MRREGRRGWDREHAVGRARRLLQRRGRPRVQLALLLLLTGCAGFLLSFALLHAGLTAMWLRYPLVIILSYCVLLLLLWAWLGVQRGANPDPDLNLTNAFDTRGGGGGVAGRGGRGGSGRAADHGALDAIDAVEVGVGIFDLPDDEGCLVAAAVVALAAAVVAGVLSAFYLVWVAPALLAEVLVDGLLVTGLYRKVKDLEGRHWLRAALRRTLPPVALTLLFFTLAGYLMQKAAPEAHSIAGFWEAVTSEDTKRPAGR